MVVLALVFWDNNVTIYMAAVPLYYEQWRTRVFTFPYVLTGISCSWFASCCPFWHKYDEITSGFNLHFHESVAHFKKVNNWEFIFLFRTLLYLISHFIFYWLNHFSWCLLVICIHFIVNNCILAFVVW